LRWRFATRPTDAGHCPDDQEPADVGLTSLRHSAEPFFLPEENRCGSSPSQAAKSRPHRKLCIAGDRTPAARVPVFFQRCAQSSGRWLRPSRGRCSTSGMTSRFRHTVSHLQIAAAKKPRIASP
jgi:hypothetical protein